MKLILMLLFSFQISFPQNEFYKFILDGYQDGFFGIHSTFILLKTEYNGTVFESVIESGELYVYIINNYNLKDIENYNFIVDIIKNNKTFKIKCITNQQKKNNQIPKEFYKIHCNEEIEKDALKGKEYFVNKYIKDSYLQSDSFENSMCIISKLFKWNIPVKQDCETGYFIVYEYDRFKNLKSR